MGAKNILIESIPVTLSLVEGASGNKVIARGKFGEVDKPTKNGRRYPRAIMQREIDRLNENIRARRVLGELGHPSDGKTELERVSHVITSLTIEDNGDVMGEAEILNTPKGNILKELISAKIPVGVSSRGHGSTAPARGTQEGEDVQEDFVLQTYDFVADPAVGTAIPGIYTEDVEVDKRTVAEMFMAEFPEIVESIKAGESSHMLSEEEGSKSISSDDIRKELSEKFERQLRDAIVEVKETVRSEVLEEAINDPNVAGAKGILAAIAEMVMAYHSEPNEDAVRDALKASTIEVSEANRERDEAISEALYAKCWLGIEKGISGHPMAETVRKLLSDRVFKTLEESEEILNTILSDLPDKGDLVSKEDMGLREENAELKGKITLLESKVDELNGKLSKAVKLGARIDEQRRSDLSEAKSKIEELERNMEKLRVEAEEAKDEAESIIEEANARISKAEIDVYKRDKVARLTNGRELLVMMEGIHDKSSVDKFVEDKGLSVVGDSRLQSMRESLGKGRLSKGIVLEEDAAPKKKSGKIELGFDMGEMAALSGIPRVE